MPTREEMEAVRARIDEVVESRFGREMDGSLFVLDPEPWRGGGDGWEDLDNDQHWEALLDEVPWNGFDEAQRRDVIRRVIDGEPSDFWMDGIEPIDKQETPSKDDPMPEDIGPLKPEDLPPPFTTGGLKQRAAEIRADEQAVRARDYGEEDAATYPARVEEGARLMEAEIAPPIDEAELLRSLDEIEASWNPSAEFAAIVEDIAEPARFEAMMYYPTKEQIEKVTSEIGSLTMDHFEISGHSIRRSGEGHMSWKDLPESGQREMIDEFVTFSGFDPDQAEAAIEKVIAGKPSSEWMYGVEQPAREEYQAARELHSMRDEEASIKLMEKGVDYGDKVDPDRPKQLDKPKSDFERMLDEAASASKYQPKGKDHDHDR